MKILAIANLYDITYKELYFNIVEMKDYYDAIVTLGDVSGEFLGDIKDILDENNIFKSIVGVEGDKDITGILNSLNIKNLHMKYDKINNLNILGFSDFSCSYKFNSNQIQTTKLLKTLNYCDILISHNNPVGINDDAFEKGFYVLNNYIEIYNPKICIHAHPSFNSIGLIKDTFVVGVHGISIVDTENLSILKLY